MSAFDPEAEARDLLIALFDPIDVAACIAEEPPSQYATILAALSRAFEAGVAQRAVAWRWYRIWESATRWSHLCRAPRVQTHYKAARERMDRLARPSEESR